MRPGFNLWVEDPLEKELATQSSTVAWRSPRTEEPGRLQFMGLQRVGHDRETFTYARGIQMILKVTDSMER